jgi:hypothetical protein
MKHSDCLGRSLAPPRFARLRLKPEVYQSGCTRDDGIEGQASEVQTEPLRVFVQCSDNWRGNRLRFHQAQSFQRHD